MANTSTDLHVSSASNNVTNPNPVNVDATITPTGTSATISATTIASDLTTHNVTLNTVTAPDNGQAGSITVDAFNAINVQAVFPNELTFNAAGQIFFGSSITGTVSLNLNAGTDIFQALGILAVDQLNGSSGADVTLKGQNAIGKLSDFSTGSNTFMLVNTIALDIEGNVTAGTVDLSLAAGGDQSSGDITTGHLRSRNGITGDLTLTSTTNAIAAVGHLAVAAGAGGNGNFVLNDNTATLTIDGAVSAAHDITITNVKAGGTIAHAPGATTQHFVVTGNAGTFTLTFNGQTTAPLAFNASESTIGQALAQLSNIAVPGGGFSLNGSGGVLDITFFGPPADSATLLVATGSGGASVAVTATGPSPLSGHDITLTADQIALDSLTTTTATDKITLAPETAGAQVTLGNAGAPVGLVIDNTELATLSAPTLTIGNATAGQINIGTATVSSATLNLVTGGGVSSVGTLKVGGGTGTLNVTANNAVDVSGNVQMGAVGGSSAVGDFKVQVNAAGALSANAITTTGGEIVLHKSGGDLTVNGALSSGGGNIDIATNSLMTLSSVIDAGVGDIALSGSTQGITQNSGHLAGDNFIAAIGSLFGGISLTAATNAIFGNVDLNAGPNGGDISFTNLSAYTIGGLSNIGSLAADHGIRTAATASVTLTMGGTVHEDIGFNDDIISTGTLNLLALAGKNPLVVLSNNNVIGDLHTVDLGTGSLLLNNSIALTVDGAVSAASVTLTTLTGLTLSAGGSVTTTVQFSLVAPVATLDGVISGSGGLRVAGGGIVTLTATDTYQGITTVAGGTLLVDGSILSSVETDVQNGATLGGHGTVGAIHVLNGGTLAPGDSPGVLTSGSVALDSGAHFQEQIGGTAAGSFDQLKVQGTVNLGGAILDLSLVNGFAPHSGSFTLIDNDGNDAVTGTFAGLADGAQINLGGVTFQLSYHGGDGNDVTLTALGGVPGDFNADRIGDVLWHNTNSSVSEWLMNAGKIAANLGVGSDSGLHFLDTGDFNADGHSDALWRDDNGNVALWTLDSAQILAKQSVGNIDATWQNQGVADFNGDGHADALWRKDGQVALWTMNGSQITANQSVTTNLGAEWRIQGLGDFNGDHDSDVLLRSSNTGQVVLWTMNGSQITANQNVTTNLGLDWHVLGTGDFTTDGKSDILVRNDNGQVALLTMNGNQITANQNVASIDASWHLQGTSDYTGDGHADVLWRNDSGQVALWEMNGNHIVSDHTVGYANGAAAPIDQSWSVLHHQFDLV